MNHLQISGRAGVVGVVGLMAVVGAAQRARSFQQRAALMGRVAGRAPKVRGVRSLETFLQTPPERVVAELRALELPLDSARLWRWWLRSCLGGAGVGAYLAGPVLGLLAGGGIAAAPIVLAGILRSRADASYDVTLASALDAVGRGVRSGGSLSQAVTEAATSVRGVVAADLAQASAAVSRGRPLVDALRDWRDARARPSVRLTVGALVLATQTGGPPARVIEDVASAIRTRHQIAREAQALAAQARLSAIVVGVAPLGFMAVTCLTDHRNAHVLFGTPIGVACVVMGLVLDALGALWMHRMSSAVIG